MGSCFPSEVPGVEFGEGGIQVVDVEDDASHDLIFGVDLRDASRLRPDRRSTAK